MRGTRRPCRPAALEGGIVAIALAGLIAAVGIGDWLVRRNTPDHTAALSGGSEGRQGAAATDVTSVDDVLVEGESSWDTTLRSSAEYITEAVASPGRCHGRVPCGNGRTQLHGRPRGVVCGGGPLLGEGACAARSTEEAGPARPIRRVPLGSPTAGRGPPPVAAQPPATPRVPRDFRSAPRPDPHGR